MGVVAYAIPMLGGRKHGQFDEFLRFFRSLAFHSHVYVRVLNNLTSNFRTTSEPLQGLAEWECWRTPSTR